MKFIGTNLSLPVEIIDNASHFIKTGERQETTNPNWLCEAFCIYVAIIDLNLQPKDFKPCFDKDLLEDKDRDLKIKEQLKKNERYKNKKISEDQWQGIINKKHLINIRNSLFHGDFEIIKKDGYSFFNIFVKDNYDYQLKINVNSMAICALKKYTKLFKSLINNQSKLANINQQLSFVLLELAQYFGGNSNVISRVSKDLLLVTPNYLFQHLIEIRNLVCSQNILYPFLKSSHEKNKLCLFRNSLAHSKIDIQGKNFILSGNGTQETIENFEYAESIFSLMADSQYLFISQTAKEIKKIQNDLLIEGISIESIKDGRNKLNQLSDKVNEKSKYLINLKEELDYFFNL